MCSVLRPTLMNLVVVGVAAAAGLGGCRAGSRPGAGGAPVVGGHAGHAAPVVSAPDGGGGSVGTGFSGLSNWPMPNPAGAGLPNPQSYDVSVADAVQDKVTGLMWQRVANVSGLRWPDAKAACQNLSLAGYHDWRLPSLIELVSIVDFSQTNPAVDRAAFPNPVGGTVWTSTPVLGSTGEAWYVSFNTGFTYLGHEDLLSIDVRCVRGGRPDPNGGRYAFPTQETVTDRGTGLLWQRTTDSTTRTWDAADAYCRALDLSGKGWRLPSMKELQTLLDLAHQVPALDPVAFPSAATEQYWTSSLLAGSTTDAWFVSFRLGTTDTISRDSPSWVRCVR